MIYKRQHLEAAYQYVSNLLPNNLMFRSGSVHFNGAGKDCDIVVFGEEAVIPLIEDGFKECVGEGYPERDEWSAYRKGGINVIVCFSDKEYTNFHKATALCKILGDRKPIDKDVRVAIHEYFRNLP